MADLYGNTTDLQSVLTAVNDVKSEVDTQTDLIAQIAVALEGKTGVNSGSGGGSANQGVNASMISFTVTGNSFGEKVFYINSDGNLVTATTDGTYQTMAGFVSVSSTGKHLKSIDEHAFEPYWCGEYEDVAICMLLDGAIITYA